MITLFRGKRIPMSVLGLDISGNRLEGVWVRRSNGSLQVVKKFDATLALNPLTDDPVLVGREIRNHLERAGIRERRCAVCLPANWVMARNIELPEMAEEDVPGFLAIEAERGFSHGPDQLAVSSFRYSSSTGKRFSTQVGVPRAHLTQLERSLKAAQLRPITMTLGITALQRPQRDSDAGVLALVFREGSVDLQVTCSGGIVALRSLDGVFEGETVHQTLSADLLLREVKITLGQLPAAVRASVRKARLFGRSEAAWRFASEAREQLDSAGLKAEIVEAYPTIEFSKSLPSGLEVSPAFSLAALCVTGVRPPFEFLPRKVSTWQQVTGRFSSRKLAWSAAAAGAAALLVGGTFLVQQWKFAHLRREWAAMSPQVHELEDMQQQIKRFRPWFDRSLRNLTILRQVTEAFPEDGIVSAKTLDIRELASVTCSGIAHDNQALLKMLDRLRGAGNVRDLKVDNIRGKTPLQFTFNFQWIDGGQD